MVFRRALSGAKCEGDHIIHNCLFVLVRGARCRRTVVGLNSAKFPILPLFVPGAFSVFGCFVYLSASPPAIVGRRPGPIVRSYAFYERSKP